MTSTAPTTVAPTVWSPPAAVRVRGTLALLAGAGESAPVYKRFGRRIAADGYVVGVFASDDADAARAWLAAQDVAPRVLAGSDRGAVAALHAFDNTEAPIDALLLAGLPTAGADDASATADQRTACPVHLGVLAASASGAESSTVPASVAGDPPASHGLPGPAALAAIAVPVLAIHGGADALSPLAEAAAALAPVPGLEFIETVDGLHDALNDVSHRSVAATIVLWLERLRTGDVTAPVVRKVRP